MPANDQTEFSTTCLAVSGKPKRLGSGGSMVAKLKLAAARSCACFTYSVAEGHAGVIL